MFLIEIDRLVLIPTPQPKQNSLSHCSLALTLSFQAQEYPSSKIFQSLIFLLLMNPPCDFHLCFNSVCFSLVPKT